MGAAEATVRRVREATVFTAVLLGIALVMLMQTARLEATSRLVPLTVVIPLTLLLLYRLVRELRGSGSASREEAGPGTRAELRSFGWLLLLPLLSSLFGYIAGPALFVFAWARVRGRERTVVAVGAAVLTVFGVWGLFAGLLQMRIPMGLLFSLVSG
jgi:hypothetical protein